MYYDLGMGRGIMAGEERQNLFHKGWQRMDVKQHVIMKRIETKFALYKVISGYTDLSKDKISFSAFRYRCNHSVVRHTSQWLGTLEPGKMVYDYKAKTFYLFTPRLPSGPI
jgi:hypothetical protein